MWSNNFALFIWNPNLESFKGLATSSHDFCSSWIGSEEADIWPWRTDGDATDCSGTYIYFGKALSHFLFLISFSRASGTWAWVDHTYQFKYPASIWGRSPICFIAFPFTSHLQPYVPPYSPGKLYKSMCCPSRYTTCKRMHFWPRNFVPENIPQRKACTHSQETMYLSHTEMFGSSKEMQATSAYH